MISIRGTHAGINLTWETSDDGGTNWFPSLAQRDDTGAAAPRRPASSRPTPRVVDDDGRCGDASASARRHGRRAPATSQSRSSRCHTRPSPSAYAAGRPPSARSTELPAAAAISDTLANPTTPQIASDQMTFNGSTWGGSGPSLTTNVDTSSRAPRRATAPRDQLRGATGPVGVDQRHRGVGHDPSCVFVCSGRRTMARLGSTGTPRTSSRLR